MARFGFTAPLVSSSRRLPCQHELSTINPHRVALAKTSVNSGAITSGLIDPMGRYRAPYTPIGRKRDRMNAVFFLEKH
jgi:hypothetical protein